MLPWPTAKDGVAHLTQAQLSMLVKKDRLASTGVDFRSTLRNPGEILALQGQIGYVCGHGNSAAGLQDELFALRALVAEQAAKLSEQEAEVGKRDSIIGILRAQLELFRHRQHGSSSEKI